MLCRRRAGPPRDRARVRALAAAGLGAPGRRELVAEGQQLPRRTVGQRRVRWAQAQLWGRARLPHQPGLCGRVRVRPHPPEEAARRARARCAGARVEVPVEEWSVCLPEHHPGYVSWDEYLATRERLRANVRPRGEGGGAAREGGALLQGILRCGRCGRRMQVAYSGTDGQRPPLCVRARPPASTPPSDVPVARRRATREGGCRGVPRGGDPGRGRAPAPGRSASSSEQHDERLAGQRLALERAEYEAERAQRQFDACEPENRLVARTLERALEEALASCRARARASSPRSEQARPAPLTDAERRALARLARELPRLWAAETTTARDRKELLRTLIGEVVVTVNARTRRAEVEIALGGRRPHRAERAARSARGPSATAPARTPSS